MGRKILIIENDVDTAYIIMVILKSAGYTVIETTVASFDADVVTTQPDLIIIDYRLESFVNGANLCEKLKNDNFTAAIPAILISACPGLPEIASACKSDAYIEKPFDINYFVSTVNIFA
jgi:two-component system phosphate regulon response regulator PhoB